MSEGLKRLKEGDFNVMKQESLPDGSVLVTLYKYGDARAVKFRVRNLYQPDEEELNVNTGKRIAKRDLQ